MLADVGALLQLVRSIDGAAGITYPPADRDAGPGIDIDLVQSSSGSAGSAGPILS